MLAVLALAAMVTMPSAERHAYYEEPEQNTLHDCRSTPEPYGECRLPPDLTAQDVEARLAGNDTAWWRDGDQFVVVARRDTDQAFLCCAARGPMDHVEGNLWAMRLRIVDLDRATIDVSVRPGSGKTWEVYRGPGAPAGLAAANALQGNVHVQTIQSRFLDAPRDVAVYTPPGFDPAKTYPVVYLADGDLRLDTPFQIEPLILKGELPPMVLVELWSGQSKSDHDLRAQEYLEGWPNGGGYFLKHESFLLNEVMPYVERNFGASTDPRDRIVTGFSSGGAWAISMGLRHPGLFPNVIAQSLVWRGVEKDLDTAGATRFFLTAGTLEPVFYDETLRFADRARASGHDVKLATTVSGHTLTIFQPMLVEGLKWFFANRKN
ncbi:MAG TPA: alpha/beta hydrolase-fold protein [Rhizomicrobium sp.]|jgi:enterochelin esterase-like enzyme|nr:alpha/beta hydrolase-fold protein [Rhizomicrobium sp.]